MKKIKKHPKDMTSNGLISDVFHPDTLKHIKKHLEEISERKKKPINKEQ